MAKLTLNSALKGIRGALDGWVYKRFGAGSIVGRQGVNESPPTDDQLAQREQFRQASDYAALALTDPTLRAFYERVAKDYGTPIRPHAVALGDYFTAPVVTGIDVTAYHGAVGNSIAVTSTPRVEATGVTVTLRDVSVPGGTPAVLETGAAARVDGKWVYTATSAVPAGHAVSIEAKAVDAHGDERSLTVQWTG